MKDYDPTPKMQHEPWRFTPSLLDPNSFAFTTLANQPPGYYTPTPGGTNTLYHSQAGDLHTPSLGILGGLVTPISVPTSEPSLQPAPMDFSSFGQVIQNPQFHNYNPFTQPSQPQQPPYASSAFVHQDAGYEAMEQDGSPLGDESRMGSMDAAMQNHSPLLAFPPRQFETNMETPMAPSGEKFRFHVTLNAPTAMIKHVDEIPVTYLNKGQAYSISVIDTTPVNPLSAGTRYRTFMRISFEDEQQRQKSATCWQLWKEGRGTSEAHQRGGKLQAVEYVEAGQSADGADKKTRVELDSASFDGFSVIWTPGTSGMPECNIAVRFNFLSTDFSHSKGVKGIPVRLCAKTQVMGTGSPHSVPDPAEVAFCKVKLFRDHGAERKLSNDIAHVKKTIDKLKQQISQAESGLKDFGKRKQSVSIPTKSMPSQRPGKVVKHKRTWSISSASSAGGRLAVEEDLHFRLQAMQDMFTSTRPVSVLYLRGLELDDPDLHPVTLAGEPPDLTKVESKESLAWQRNSLRSSSTTATSSLVSPSPSSISLPSQALAGASASGQPGQWSEFHPIAHADVQASNPQQPACPSDHLTRVSRMDNGGGWNGWIEALGVDPSYKPPSERPVRPVACFYVLNRDPAHPEKQEYYRAVYLMQRTLKAFVHSVAAKWKLEPAKILRVFRALPRGLDVEVDDDVIREIAEGQDMVMEISRIDVPEVKNEWDAAMNIAIDGVTPNVVHIDGYELRLIF